jgi:hypothetical protein
VLVSGAEICRQLTALDAASWIMLDRDESALHATQLSILGHSQLETPNLVGADIRERFRVDEVFAQWRPEVVFHAAARKHVPLLEMRPIEAIKTNVAGTQFTLDAAGRLGRATVREHLHPQGRQPRQCARLHQANRRAAHRVGGDVPRPTVPQRPFGNLLGTRGSALTTFQHQIASEVRWPRSSPGPSVATRRCRSCRPDPRGPDATRRPVRGAECENRGGKSEFAQTLRVWAVRRRRIPTVSTLPTSTSPTPAATNGKVELEPVNASFPVDTVQFARVICVETV